MSEILHMQSVPILNITDFYRYFDVLDVLHDREAFSRFAAGHLKWSGSINLHHLDVIQMMEKDKAPFQMKDASDYWLLSGGLSRNLLKTMDRYENLPEYEKQAETAEAVYKKYGQELKENDSRIIMQVIASILLAEKDEGCLEQIDGEQLKKAYYHRREPLDTQPDMKERVVPLTFRGGEASITLHALNGVYRFNIDSSRSPSYEERMRTCRIDAEAEARIQFFNPVTGDSEEYTLLRGERMYCLVLGEMILRILPGCVVNGGNTICRKPDGIYINDKKYSAIPADASSFAVNQDAGNPQYVYVKDGHIDYGNYDNMNGRAKVPEELAVISEVREEDNRLIVIRNDGKIWDGERFC